MMVVGIPNANLLVPVEKMKISKYTSSGELGDSFEVLYNPESYSMQRSTNYTETAGLASNMPSIQFISGTTETLQMELFFDSFYSGAEVGGGLTDKAKFAGNSLLPSLGKQIDVRTYTAKVYDLMIIEGDIHVPPLLKLEWGSLQFTGHLVACTQNFTKFNEAGKPVRARLNCTFKQYMTPSEIAAMAPLESPDTAKYRTVQQGDSLWAFSAREYGTSSSWREIAEANGIDNPRLLETGVSIQLPALRS